MRAWRKAHVTSNTISTLAFGPPRSVSPFAVAAMVDNSNQSWLNSLWESIANDDYPGYYDDTLKLLSLVALSGNWWSPESVSCPP